LPSPFHPPPGPKLAFLPTLYTSLTIFLLLVNRPKPGTVQDLAANSLSSHRRPFFSYTAHLFSSLHFFSHSSFLFFLNRQKNLHKHIMYLSRLLAGSTTLVLLLSLVYTPTFALTANQRERRDLLGSLLPLNNPAPAPAPAPVPASPPAVSPIAGTPAGSPTTTTPPPDPVIAPLPSLIGGVLTHPPLIGGGGSSSSTAGATVPSATVPGKKQPTNGASSPTVSDSDSDDGGSGNTGNNSKNTGSKIGGDDGAVSENPLSPGVIALIVVVLVAILVVIVFSTFRIRQARQKRRQRQSWDQDILRNNAGSVGYSEGAGYGMYVGQEKSDVFRKNLDLFHYRV